MISDKYAVIKKIAATGHADVYLVRHRQLEAVRIAKVVSKDTPDYSRVLREAMLIKDLKFDGLPIIYDIEEDSISICIIEEYIAGKSLEEYLQQSGTFTVKQITDVAISICNIVEYLHDRAGIVHLDIKPSNIIIAGDVEKDSEKPDVHLIDFDSSRRSDSRSGKAYGTVGYAAPEQFFGKGCIASDIYSIGILIAYMANNGHWQSMKDDIHSVCRLYHESVGPVIEKCLRHSQNQRYQSIALLKKDLERIRSREDCRNNKTAHVAASVTDVYVSGTRHGIGTTHFCLCMASFLARNGKTVIVIRHGDSEDLKSDKICACYKNGAITHSGVVIRPEYGGCVSEDSKDYVYRIHDMGTCHNKHSGRINILVGDCGYRRCDYEVMDRSDRDTIIFINHISGTDFYRYSRQRSTSGKIYRFPCMYEWNRKNELFEEAMCEVLGVKRKKGWFGR